MEKLFATCTELYQRLGPQDVDKNNIGQFLRNPEIKRLTDQIQHQLQNCGPVYTPENQKHPSPQAEHNFRAVTWNLERGKNFSDVLHTLKHHPELQDADFYLFTEVDWGMVRSENRNVAAELGEVLGYHAYFAPSYFNFTKGHGSERHFSGKNAVGLHGKAILSRHPLNNLRTIAMPNATDKFNSKEVRLGQKRALLGELNVGPKTLTLACTHLDAFSSPKSRTLQLMEVTKVCQDRANCLIGGDWNTNTLNSTSTGRLIPTVLYQQFRFGPVKMVTQHFPYPERTFDRPLFDMLNSQGFNYESCNESGAGTYDLVTGDQDLGKMANDQFPFWTLKLINRLIDKAGGNISMKLDWFAEKNLNCSLKKSCKIKSGRKRSA